MNQLRMLGLLLIIVTVMSNLAVAQSHFWYLVDPGNDKWYESTRNPGTLFHEYFPYETINGYQVRYLERVSGGDVTGLNCSLMSDNPEGDVFIHGSCDAPGATKLLIDSPLWVGKFWQVDINTTAEVVAEEELSVPFGGPHPCFVIEYVTEFDPFDSISRYWVSDGIGVVKQVADVREPEDALILFDGVIPVARSTWGSLKGQYR